MKAGLPEIVICFALGVVCFVLGMFTTNYRVTFDGPSEEPAPAPSPYAFEGEGWTIKKIKTGPSLPNVYELTAPDGVRWVSYDHSLQPWPVKTPDSR